MFKFGCSVCNKTWGIGEARACTCAPEDDDDIQQYKKPWVGLTDEEILIELERVDPYTKRLPSGLKLFAYYLEARLKDKNT